MFIPLNFFSLCFSLSRSLENKFLFHINFEHPVICIRISDTNFCIPGKKFSQSFRSFALNKAFRPEIINNLCTQILFYKFSHNTKDQVRKFSFLTRRWFSILQMSRTEYKCTYFLSIYRRYTLMEHWAVYVCLFKQTTVRGR